VIELYGVLDPITRDWTDGLLSNIFREVNKPLENPDKPEFKYILFDGDVDAIWVENMNSVMDDNKLLTLSNGERIRMQNHSALLFEVSFSFELIALFDRKIALKTSVIEEYPSCECTLHMFTQIRGFITHSCGKSWMDTHK